MYGDRIEAEANGSIEDRREGNSTARSLVSSKRQRKEDDGLFLFEDNEPQVSGQMVGDGDGDLCPIEDICTCEDTCEDMCEARRNLLLQRSRELRAPPLKFRPPALRSNVPRPFSSKSVIDQAPTPEEGDKKG